MSDEYYGQSAEARARRRRAVITLLLALLMIFFAVWYAMSYIRADDERRATESSSSATPTCETKASEFKVNVYNATDQEGLATTVARDLRKRGFDVQTVANDPKGTEVTGPGELRHGTNGTKGAELLSDHLGDFSIDKDERDRTTVDVVLGPDYERLVAEDTAPDC